MLFSRCVFTNLLLAQGKVHIAKLHFQKIASLILRMFPTTFGTLNKKGPRGPFEGQEGPFQKGRCVVCVCVVPSVSVESGMESNDVLNDLFFALCL